MAFYNPFADRTEDEINAAWEKAFAPTTVMTNGPEDWFNSQSKFYQDAYGQAGAYGGMLDTVADRLLSELKIDIADRNARRGIAQNLLGGARDTALLQNVTGNNTGATGTQSEAMRQVGSKFLRTGSLGENPYKDTFATIQRNREAALAAGEPGKASLRLYDQPQTQSALENLALRQLAGPYRSLLQEDFGTAARDAGLGGLSYYGTLKANPFLMGGTAYGTLPTWAQPAPQPAPEPAHVPQPQPTPEPSGQGGHDTPAAPVPPMSTLPPPPVSAEPPMTADTGGPLVGGQPTPGLGGAYGTTPIVTNPITQQPVFDVDNTFQQLFGRPPQNYERVYWNQKALDLGPAEAYARLSNSPAAEAFRRTGAPPPFLTSANDRASAEAYYQYLAAQGLAPADREAFIAALLGNYAEWNPLVSRY